jgi:hypothetical protein
MPSVSRIVRQQQRQMGVVTVRNSNTRTTTTSCDVNCGSHQINPLWSVLRQRKPSQYRRQYPTNRSFSSSKLMDPDRCHLNVVYRFVSVVHFVLGSFSCDQ